MEDFILNEIIDSQEESSMSIIDDGNVENSEESLSADAGDVCPNVLEEPYPYQFQNPYSDFYEEDRNGDGIVDHITSYVDDNFDGNIDRTVELSDNDGDGFLETTNIEEDTNGDGSSDAWYKGVDINGDGNDNIVEVLTLRNDLQKKYIYHKNKEFHGTIDYSHAEYKHQ